MPVPFNKQNRRNDMNMLVLLTLIPLASCASHVEVSILKDQVNEYKGRTEVLERKVDSLSQHSDNVDKFLYFHLQRLDQNQKAILNFIEKSKI